MRWPGLGEVSPPRGMTASGSSESLLTGLFQPARTCSLVFWAPLLTVTVPRVSVVDASTVKPRPTPRGSHLPRAHVTQTSVSPARGVVALCPPGGPRPKHRRATAVAVCGPSGGACAQPGTRTSTAGRRRAQGVTCVAAKATLSPLRWGRGCTRAPASEKVHACRVPRSCRSAVCVQVVSIPVPRASVHASVCLHLHADF